MRMNDLIAKKRDGLELTTEEIRYVVFEYTNGNIPDYQISAFLMAVYFNGMNKRETLDLTMAMRDSGDVLDLSQIDGVKVDKHSTGGVGDKTTLVLAPMVAACGVPVAKMSGRGLGHTGGTIDKLESIDGYQTSISEDVFIKNVNNIKIAVTGQTANLAPADKKIYALRDVTATVDNISLIASSIMSKKLALGADGIVLDVKTGSGAFMKEEKDAISLAQEMVDIGTGAGKDIVAVITDMDQPLGKAVGNSLEVIEAIETLKGKGPDDLMELCYVLGSYMLVLGKKAKNTEEAREMLKDVIETGKALDKFAQLVEAQGGNPEFVYDTGKFKKASIVMEVQSARSGYVEKIHTGDIGEVALILGGGRTTKESIIDLSVGIILHKKVGDKVEKGETIATLYANDPDRLSEAKDRLLSAYDITVTPAKADILVKWIVSKNGAKKY